MEHEKEWLTVMKHKGYQIQIMNNAGILDPMGYRIEPEVIGHEGENFDSVGVAIDAIEKAVYII